MRPTSNRPSMPQVTRAVNGASGRRPAIHVAPGPASGLARATGTSTLDRRNSAEPEPVGQGRPIAPAPLKRLASALAVAHEGKPASIRAIHLRAARAQRAVIHAPLLPRNGHLPVRA